MMNKVILITGGTSGFGYATAELFAKRGEKVIITGRNETTLREAAQTLGCDFFVPMLPVWKTGSHWKRSFVKNTADWIFS